jgi:2,3-bisphosphoglycerate-dependent phosphoglycerate mutase
VPDLVFLRHGESVWNAENRFTGWTDVDLTARGEDEARSAGRRLADELATPGGPRVGVVHTSVLTRAVRTANLALDTMGRTWLPVRRHWRLNERHYGALQGKNKSETTAEFGEEQVRAWRRSYDVPPPALDLADPAHPANDPRYGELAPGALPASECLADVVRRVVPYWEDAIVPDLHAFAGALVVAHGNSIRAAVKYLKAIPDSEIVGLEIPTGIPWLFRFDDRMRLVEDRWLGDAAEVAAAAERVARQADVH